MRIRYLHSWDPLGEDPLDLQRRLAREAILMGEVPNPRLVGGCDAAYDPHGEWIYATAVVWDLRERCLVDSSLARGKASFPYRSGLLGFREAPWLLEALSRLKVEPEVLLVDGQGVAHPRGCGLATHLGLHLEIPTVGCAKKRLVGEHPPLGPNKGDFQWLWYGGERVGVVVRSRDRVRPLYVSPGHRIGLEGALRAVLACLGSYRLPEPLRHAHLLAERAKRREASRPAANGPVDPPSL
jgi:deoxyribonuclease V